MQKIHKFLNRYGIYLLILLCLVIGISSLYFRNSTLDDDLYLLETSIMTEALSKGEWVGHYAVGVHGFLFKLPVALIFLLTGPSLTIATIWNILIGCSILYLFYNILKKYFKDPLMALSATTLLFANFQFILHLPTYMREYPVVLSLLLLIYLLINKKSYWLLGLALMLVLDAKESVFFMILPGIFFYLLIYYYKGLNLKTVTEYLKRGTMIILPSVIYILLMIFTSLIPLNTVIFTVIPGVTQGGVEYQLEHFEVGAATQSIVRLKTPEATTIQEIIPVAVEEETESFLYKTLSVIIGYVGKILYPRTFSFLSIPKILFFPAILSSILLFKKKLKQKDETFLFLSLILWSFIAVYIFRLSFDRYLFPILPVCFFFFLIFLKEIVKNKKTYLWILSISSILSLLGLIFEADYVHIKLLLNLLIIISLILYAIYKDKLKNPILYISTFISILTFSVIAFYYYSDGQLRKYLMWGRDYQVKEVIQNFQPEEKIMLNDVGWDLLPEVYRGDVVYNPEWKWELKEWVPRKKHLRMFERIKTFKLDDISFENDILFIQKYEIEKVGIMVSGIEGVEFPQQDRLYQYLKNEMFELIQTIELKNKTLYIFNVIE